MNGSVYALAVSEGVVYAGGYFASVGGQVRNYIAAIDASTGALTSWNPNANDEVYALAVGGGVVYAGGSFTTIGEQTRNFLPPSMLPQGRQPPGTRTRTTRFMLLPR